MSWLWKELLLAGITSAEKAEAYVWSQPVCVNILGKPWIDDQSMKPMLLCRITFA